MPSLVLKGTGVLQVTVYYGSCYADVIILLVQPLCIALPINYIINVHISAASYLIQKV